MDFKQKLFLLLYTVFICSFSAHALVVDEKLTLRVLKLSDSKRTILINRGVEDGLVKGDHAKFYLSTGVVARGVVVKTAPSRSIWSLYRIIDSKKISADAVLNLKISTPVKVSADRTRIVYTPTRPVGTDISKTGIVLAEGADDLDELSAGEETDLTALESEGSEVPLIYRSWEVWGILQITNLRSNTDANVSGFNDASLNTQGELTNWDFAFGFEKYFQSLNEWYSNFSFFPFFRYYDLEASSLAGRNIRERLYEGGVGVNWHFFNRPHEVRSIIGYLTVSGGAGRAREFTILNESGVITTGETRGSERFYAGGIGMKYYIGVGFGLRTILDYYRRTIDYDAVEGSGSTFRRTSHGFRFYLGLSWRI